MPTQRVVIALLVSALAASALAQDGPEPEAADGLLSGPTVEAKPSLLRYGLDGRLERIEGRPEIAAAELLLGGDTQAVDALARVRRIAAARLDAVRMLLVDELEAVRVITDLTVAGEDQAARDELRSLWERFEPGRPHAPMLDSLADVLGPTRAEALRTMVEEYWVALLAERLQRRLGEGGQDASAEMESGMLGQMVDTEAVMASDDPVISAARDRLAFQLFQREIRVAYDQSLARYRELLESIDTAIKPTEAQRAAIREVILEHIKATRLQATPAQRRAAMVAVYRELDQTRREKLYELLLRQVVPG